MLFKPSFKLLELLTAQYLQFQRWASFLLWSQIYPRIRINKMLLRGFTVSQYEVFCCREENLVALKQSSVLCGMQASASQGWLESTTLKSANSSADSEDAKERGYVEIGRITQKPKKARGSNGSQNLSQRDSGNEENWDCMSAVSMAMETWLVQEWCDMGSLDRAVGKGVFILDDIHMDMVRLVHVYICDCLFGPHLIEAVVRIEDNKMHAYQLLVCTYLRQRNMQNSCMNHACSWDLPISHVYFSVEHGGHLHRYLPRHDVSEEPQHNPWGFEN